MIGLGFPTRFREKKASYAGTSAIANHRISNRAATARVGIARVCGRSSPEITGPAACGRTLFPNVKRIPKTGYRQISPIQERSLEPRAVLHNFSPSLAS